MTQPTTPEPTPAPPSPPPPAESTPPAGPDISAIAAKYKRSGKGSPPSPAPAAASLEPAKADAATEAPVTPEVTPSAPNEPELPAVVEKKPDEELTALAKATRERRLATQEARAATQRTQQSEEAIAKDRELLDLAKSNPLAFLERLGVPPEAIAEQVIKRGSPEAAAEELKAKVDRLEADVREREQRAQQTLAFQRQREAETSFIAMVKDNASKYEALNALYEPPEILNAARSVIAWVQKHQPGVTYDDSEIAETIEARLSKRYSAIKERFAAAPKSAPTEQKPKGHEPGPDKSRTLTSSLQSETAPPTEIKKLPRKEQNKHFAAQLRATMGKRE